MVAEKSLTEKNVHMYYIREKEGKNENLKKEGKMNTLAPIGAEGSATEFSLERKKINK